MARKSMREEISVAALDRFRTRGYNAAGVADITDAAGVPKGSFYNHFGSKEAMAVEALARYGTTVGLDILADTAVPPLTRLRAHFEALREQTVTAGYTQGCLVGNLTAEIADHSAPIRAALHDSFTRWTTLIAATLTEADRHDPATTATFILSAWEGTVLTARADHGPAAFDAFFHTVFDVLLA